MGYSDRFGGSPVQPADVSYNAITLAANLTLQWPSLITSSSQTPLARINDVTPTGAGFVITLPDAREVSTGQDALFANYGADSYQINDAAGNVIVIVNAGINKYLYLTDNSTAAGTWHVVQFAAGTSAADASVLAGMGLQAVGAQLWAARPTVTVSASFAVTSGDRAKNFAWTGGVGTMSLPAVGSVGTNFFISVANQGTGVLTITGSGGELIDSLSSIQIQPNESCNIHAGASAWYTVGRGRSTTLNFTLLSKTVTGGTTTLTPTEAANIVQKYTGTLTSNQIVVLPSVVQIYYVQNLTTGAFTLTFKTAGVGTTVQIPQGANAILFSDGTNVVNTSTTAAGISSISLTPGSANSPSLSFVGDITTGIFQPTSGTIGFTTNSVERMRIDGSGNVGIGLTPSGTYQLEVNNTAAAARFTPTSSTAPVNGMYLPAANSVGFATNSSERLRIDSNGKFGIGAPSNSLQLYIQNATGAAGVSQSIDNGSLTGFASYRLNNGNTSETNAGAAFSSFNGSWASTGAKLASGATLTSYGTGGLQLSTENASGSIKFFTGGASPTERMRIESSGQIGIGLTPSGIYPLEVNGAVGAGRFVATAATLPTNGMYLPAANSVGFATNSTERARIDSSGNVGVGLTPSGTYPLEINGIVGAGGFTPTSATLPVNGMYLPAANSVGFTTSSTARVRIDSSGNLIVGDTTARFSAANRGDVEVNGSTSSLFGLSVGGSAKGYILADTTRISLFTTTAGNLPLVLGSKDTEYCRINTSNQLDIGGGGSVPVAEKLQLAKYDVTGGYFVNFANRGSNVSHANTYSVGGIRATGYRDIADPAYIAEVSFERASAAGGLASKGSIVFKTDSSGQGSASSLSERARIDSSGNFLVGSSSSLFGNANRGAVEVSGSAEAVFGLCAAGSQLGYFYGDSSGVFVRTTTTNPLILGVNGSESIRINSSQDALFGQLVNGLVDSNSHALGRNGQHYINHITGTGSGTGYATFGYAAGAIGSITQNGTTAVLYNTTSDERLKTNIADALDAGNTIDSIKIRSFNWKADGSPVNYGFIAQELGEIFPEAVHVGGDDEKSNPWGVDPSKLVALMIKEIQSLRKRVTELESAK